MSQNQEVMMSTGSSETLAAEMPSVPGVETAKSIIENAVHPHPGAPATAPAAQPATPASVSATAQPAVPAGVPAMSEPFADQVLELSIMGEALTFSKRAMVTEEVLLRKRPFTEQKSVTGSVRRERVTVEGADVVEGADDQIDRAPSGAGSAQGTRGAAQDTMREGAEHTHEGAANAKHGIDGMIDGAVDRLFGGHHQ
jgi:hypothetical protein